MKIIQIKPKTVKKYKKQSSFIKEGNYILVDRPNEKEKKFFPFIPTDYQGFAWLLPCEDWILKSMYNQRIVYSFDNTELDLKALDHLLEKLPFHSWQKTYLLQVKQSLLAGKCYRKGLIVALGGGKTLVALTLCQMNVEKAIYIAPKHLHFTIKNEAVKWQLDCPTIITPESAKKHTDKEFFICILDEALLCKNPTAKRSMSVRLLFNNARIGLAMTGTPLSVSPVDIRWLRIFQEGFVPEQENIWKWRFGINPGFRCPEGVPERKLPRSKDGSRKYPLCIDGWKIEKASKFCKDCLKTIKIDEIMKDIPEFQKQRIYLPAPKWYYEILNGIFTEKYTTKKIIQARTSTAGFIYNDNGEAVLLDDNKIPVKIQWVLSFLETNLNEAVVVFSNWQKEQALIKEHLEKKGYNPDIVSQSEKKIENFLSGKTRILICSASLSEGMNLQRARIAVFFSNSTQPVKRQQAIGRLYRQGQKRQVIIYDLICKNTLDEVALDLIENHLNASSKFIEKQLEMALKSFLRKEKK